jgi:transaldolase
MELFLDTADAQAVKELSETLTIAGVTTNPTIITRSGKTLEQVIDEMCKTLAPNQKSFFQVVATDFDGILEEARRICALRENAYAKIPVTPVGLKAIKAAKAEGLNVLATAIYTANQAFPCGDERRGLPCALRQPHVQLRRRRGPGGRPGEHALHQRPAVQDLRRILQEYRAGA